MLVDVRIPTLPESIPDARLLAWRVRAGERVERGDVLLEVETDKVVLEVPAPESGILATVVLAEGENGESGQLIARIETDGGEAVPSAPEKADDRPGPPPPPSGGAPSEIAMGPAVRRIVAEHGLDPAAIPASGRDGRITKADALRHLEAAGVSGGPVPGGTAGAGAAVETGASTGPGTEPGPPPAAGTVPSPPPAGAPSPPRPDAAPAPAPEARGERREPMSRLRRRIAERLLESQRNAAILTTFNEVDMQPVMDLRSRHREDFERRHGARLGFMSFFVKAAVQALRRFPPVNAFIDGEDLVFHDYCDIGVAVGSPRGLVVPVLRNAEGLSFAAIEQAIARFGEQARDGTLALEDLVGGTFTISNGGVFGSLLSTPILNPAAERDPRDAPDPAPPGGGRPGSGGGPADDVPRALVRSPHHRRARGGGVPGDDQGSDRRPRAPAPRRLSLLAWPTATPHRRTRMPTT